MPHEHVMIKQIFYRYTKRHNAQPTCVTCGKTIDIGDEYVSSNKTRGGCRTYRHKDCYESTFIDV